MGEIARCFTKLLVKRRENRMAIKGRYYPLIATFFFASAAPSLFFCPSPMFRVACGLSLTLGSSPRNFVEHFAR